MTTGLSTLLGLALPVDGELDGTWGDVVNYAITDYVDIAVAGTLTLNGDGAVTLANTNGDELGTNISATTAQYAIIRITGTLTTTKIITAPSTTPSGATYSKSYIVDNAATGGTVTFKASGQTGVSVAVGEKCTVYFNGTDYVKVASSVADGVTSVGGTGTVNGITLTGTVTSTGNLTLGGALTGVNLASQVTGTLPVANGGTGITSFGAGVATFLGTPSSANLAAAVTDETGTGSLVFASSPTLAGTPLAPTATLGTNTTQIATTAFVKAEIGATSVNSFSAGTTGFTPSTATTGAVTLSGTLAATNGGTGLTSLGAGVATFLGTPSSANLATAVTDETGSGALVFANTPTLIAPLLGTPTSGTLTTCTGLPISTGVDGLGTNVATFLGTPSSANLRAALTDETGTGVAVFGTSPAITTSLTTPSTTFALVNTTATTLNFGGAATTLNVGAATGTMTVGNTTLAAKAITASTTLGVTGAATIQGLTVGLGGGAIAGNTVLGASAFAANTSGNNNTAIGQSALTNNTDGNSNVAIGSNALAVNTTGFSNVAVGTAALALNSSGTSNTAIGIDALRENTAGINNVAIGGSALYYTTGSTNTVIGYGAGSGITTGSNNVIIGGNSGSSAPISQTGSNWIVLSDGAGTVRQAIDPAGNISFANALVVYAPEPASISTTATLTNANIQTQLIVTTGTSFTLTMPLGTDLENLVTWIISNLGYDFSVINTASGTITMAGNTGVTIVGRATVTTNVSARFRIRRTAANTFIMYRIA